MKKTSELKGQAVVITGASSGIGREASIAFARQGCRVALAARRRDALEEVAEACKHAGGEAMVIPTDVTREDEVQKLAEQTLSEWKRIDIWINNAGTTLFGHLDQGDFALHRQVLETNLIGAMHGARAVLPVFYSQRAGTLINVASVLAEVGQPFTPSYVISKFGLRGLSEALRAEVADQPAIHICTIMPYAVDTPHFQSGANLIGLKAHAMPPVQPPERVANAIVALAKRPVREVHVPHYMALGIVLHWLLPRTTERLLLHALQAFHFGTREAPKTGSLFHPPSQPGKTHGVRRPLTSPSAFAFWLLRDLARTSMSSVRRMLYH